MIRITALCCILLSPLRSAAQDTSSLQISRKINVFYMNTGEKRMEANLVITGGSQAEFVKVSESIKGVTSLLLKGKLKSDVAVRKDDTSFTWIFPEITGNVEISYSCVIKDSTVRVSGRWITEKNPSCKTCVVAKDTTLAYTPALDLYVLNATKYRERTEKQKRAQEEKERLKKLEDEKKRIQKEKDDLAKAERDRLVKEKQEKDYLAKLERDKLLREKRTSD
ncbi:MAG: hypothetical protein ACHQF2_11345, partial [Flavobacteriales bacterium]